ncbi:hypothetical protein [Haloarchaeobius sp. TZWWS8]|uniref:hypothetical protein n=1 Tax=Haloarchaeobius sp. TZWWS8 TaxID=3446121 RepID=UPI003EBEA172
MRLPRGELVQSRVVDSPATPLRTALDRELDGYLLLEPQHSLLFDDEGAGIVTLEAGVPVLAYHLGAECGGVEALTTLAGTGPYSAELYEVPSGSLASAHETESLRVSPDDPANRLAGETELADRTRDAAPTSLLDAEPVGDDLDPVEAFLSDDSKIAAIQRQAEEEAARRAEEWGLTDVLADSPGRDAPADSSKRDDAPADSPVPTDDPSASPECTDRE